MGLYETSEAARRKVLDDADNLIAALEAAKVAAAADLAAAVAETRRVTTALEEARAEIDGLHEVLTGVQQENTDLLGVIESLRRTIATLEAEVEKLRARINELDPPAEPRDPFVQPYASDSFLNLARRVDATLGTKDHPMAVSLRSVKGGFNRTTFTTPINESDDSPVPLVIQEVPEGGWRPSSTDARHVIEWAPASITIAGDMTAYPPSLNTDGTVTFPTAPPGTKPDGFFSLTNRATGECVQAYKVCWGPDGPAGRVLLARRGSVRTFDLRGDVLDVQGPRASRLDLVGGLIRDGELESSIDHVMYLAMTKTQTQALTTGVVGYVPPARGRDTAGGYTGTIPLGQHFYLDPSVDVTTLGLSPAGLVLARGLQTYGAVHTDTAGWTVLYFEQGPMTDAMLAAKLDWQAKILPLMVPVLDVVALDSLTAGARVAPPAAPLA